MLELIGVGPRMLLLLLLLLLLQESCTGCKVVVKLQAGKSTESAFVLNLQRCGKLADLRQDLAGEHASFDQFCSFRLNTWRQRHLVPQCMALRRVKTRQRDYGWATRVKRFCHGDSEVALAMALRTRSSARAVKSSTDSSSNVTILVT